MGLSRPRLLVVGGNGFIGRFVTNNALSMGWRVFSLNLSLPVVGDRVDGVVYLAADITNSNELKKALPEPDFEYVVNCGGYINHALFSNGGRKIFDAHFSGVLNLTQILNRDNLISYVNIGSSDEYGSNKAPQIETQREAPISPYSCGKVAATHLLEMLHRTEGFPSTTLRLFLTYGPSQDAGRFLPQIIMGCLEGRSFPASSGEQLRDFCFVQDTVTAIFAVFTEPMARGETINIGSGVGVSIRHMVEMVQSLVGRGQPLFGKIAYRSGESMALYADVTKAMELLGWSASVSLEDGLLQTIRWVEDGL